MNENLKDQQDRQNAVEVCDKNIIVEAGAGTGKTTLLVKKILFLIFVKGVKLSRLIALTFTKKAAASLKQKLQEDLHSAYKILLHHSFVLNDDDINFEKDLNAHPNKEDIEDFKKFRALFKKSGADSKALFDIIKTALEEIPFCQIGTIHSFCLFILKKYALEAKLNPNINIDENDYIDIIFDKYWAIFLDEELSANSQNKNHWLNILKEVSLTDLKYFARNLCAVRFQDYTPTENYEFLKQQAQQYIKEAELLIANAPDTRGKIKPVLSLCIESLTQAIAFYSGQRNDFKVIDLPAINPSRPKSWEDADYEIAEKIMNFTRENTPEKQIIFIQACNLLKSFTAQVQQEITKQNYLTFDEIIFKTRSLLLTNKSVREELKRSYDKIFIDEFQDTDPMQGEIMLFLAEGISAFAQQWQDLKLTPGKLFIVGDPKQSIYHFRGADISAYQAFCNLLTAQGALTCNLQNNFRSAKKIIDYVNIFGKSQITFKENRQSEYKEIYPSKEFKNPRLELHLYEGELSSEGFCKNFAERVAKWICENVEKTNKNDGTPLKYKDIAVLIPTSTNVNIFLDALKENDIPYNIEADKNFYSAQEVLDFINILKVLKNPHDQVALLGVLRSPAGLITDEELLNLSKQKELNIYAKTENKKVQNIYNKLKALKEKLAHLNPLEITNEVLESFLFAPYQSLVSLREQTLANIYKIKQVVETIYHNGAYTLEQLLDNFETYQKEKQEESSAMLAEEDFNVIKILSVHKAKGLEYPVVILTGISKNFTQTGNKQERWQDKAFYSRSLNKKGLILGKGLKDGIISFIKEEKETQEYEEKKRLLYVAMTRAKEALIIIDKLQIANNTITNFLASAGCWPMQKEETLHNAEITYLQAQEIDPSFRAQNFPENKDFVFDYQTWQDNQTQREEEYKKYLSTLQVKSDEGATIYPTPKAEHAIKVGNLCHKLLQNIFTGINNNLDTENDKEALEEAKNVVENFCKTPAFKELKEMEFLAAEFPITTIENGLTKNGIIDAIFKAKDGKIKIIDFKSDKINIVSAKTVEPNYLTQITFYKNALKKILGGNVEGALVYIRPAEIYNIED